MADADDGFGFASALAGPPSLVYLAPFSRIPSPSPRRLSSHFSQPARPVRREVRSARRLAWVNLQGRLVNADEASSARTIGGGLSLKEAMAWELFSPIHRFLIVAVIGVAVVESKKNRHILQLKKSVEIRDQVLSSMQQKLDDLCEQMSNIKDQQKKPEADMSFSKGVESLVDCGCWLCDQHGDLSNVLAIKGNSVLKVSSADDDVLQYKIPFAQEAEQEERRVSDFSDWASSVTSAAEMQMNSLAIEQDIYNLKRDCEEKEATIKELRTILHSSEVAGSKRVAELEDIIRGKSTKITKLKKDMAVLEQKVVHLTRLNRPSSTARSSSLQLPVMADNLLYDMDSTTGPSSSDSDHSPVNRPRTATPVQNSELSSSRNWKSPPAKASSSMMRLTEWHTKSRPTSPLREITPNQKFDTVSSSSQKQLMASADFKKTRRRTQTGSKDATPKRRWV